MTVAEVVKTIKDLPKEDREIVLLAANIVKIEQKKEEVYEIDGRIDDIIRGLAADYKIINEDGAELSGIDFQYDESEDAVIVTVRYY